MPFRRSKRRKNDTQTLILLLVSVLALLAAYGAWKGLVSIRKYTAASHAYDSLILEISERHGVDPSLVKAVIWRESGFRPYARGTSGEIGLMQIMSDKAVSDWARRHKRPDPPKGSLFTPRLNIEIGTWYLARALRRWSSYKDREILALCEYNAGITRANAWKPADPNDPVAPRITIASTRAYAEKILKKREDYKDNWKIKPTRKKRSRK